MRTIQSMGASVVLLLCGARAWGCSCKATPSEKEAWQSARAVFLGQVERADSQTVSVHVDEAFKGPQAGQVIELLQSSRPCMMKLAAGERVVIYLMSAPTQGKPGRWVAGCGRGVHAAAVPDDLLFLRKLPESAKGNRISGTVSLREDSGTTHLRGVPGVTVRISARGRPSTEVVTDAEGEYEFYGFAGGIYNVEIKVPEKLKTDSILKSGRHWGGDESTVDLRFDPHVSVRFWLRASE